MKTGTNELDMTRGSILPKMITFAIPLILTSLLQSLFTTADLAVVEKFGREAALAIEFAVVFRKCKRESENKNTVNV